MDELPGMWEEADLIDGETDTADVWKEADLLADKLTEAAEDADAEAFLKGEPEGNSATDSSEDGLTLKVLEDAIFPGAFAVQREGVWRFFKVDKPVTGKWKGWTFVKYQASDELHPVKSPVARQDILESIILAGARECAEQYGIQIGQCGVCGRTLTDEHSIARGIGPVCAERMGWEYE